jgi:tellurite resistance protein
MNALFRSRPIPLASFTAAMGIVGLGLDWRLAAHLGYAGAIAGELIAALGIAVFVLLGARWLMRIRSDRREIAAEAAVALTANYFGAIDISVALIAAAVVPYSEALARGLWFVAAGGGIALVLFLLGKWIETGIDDFSLTPAILLPVVGNAVSVYVAADLGVEQYAFFSFAIALVCWLCFMPLSLYRLLVVKPPLPRKLAPQLSILVSSPAVIANAWFVLDGGRIDDVMKLLACTSLFFALLAIRTWRLGWGEPFNVAMWGWTFPAAAIAGTYGRIAFASPSLPTALLAHVLWILATLITAACAVGAVRGWLVQAKAIDSSAVA